MYRALSRWSLQSASNYIELPSIQQSAMLGASKIMDLDCYACFGCHAQTTTRLRIRGRSRFGVHH